MGFSWKLVGAATVLVLGTLIAFFGAAGAAPAATCKAGVQTIDGNPARVFCGSAKATVRMSGKTLSFSGGSCEQSGGGFVVNIGTFFAGSGTSKRPYFGLFVTKSRPGTYARQTLAFRSGGVSHAVLATVTLKGSKGGTFSGDSVSGSFTC